jgi:nitrite reductase/ring-hydroxylating ferredoxin subunit
MSAARARIATLDQLRTSQSVAFDFREEGIPRQGFLAFHEGRVVAYENRCRHLPLPLDYGDQRFFTPDGGHFICQNHGALYEPLSGRCVAGPCAGAALRPLAIEITDNEIFLVEPGVEALTGG